MPENEPLTTNIDQQEFNNWGFDARYANAWGDQNILTVGTTSYWGDSPRTRHVSNDIRSNQQNAEDLLFDQDRKMSYNAIFIENLFRFDKLSVIPTARYERINYDLEELTRNPNLSRDAINLDETENELLFGLGLMYQLSDVSEVYANISESYRPQRFDDLANPNSELAATNGPDVSRAMNYEIGFRSAPIQGLTIDISAFRIDFDDKIETIQVNIADIERVNSGDSRHQGVEFSIDYDLLAGSENSLRIFANGSLLDAEIVSSQNAALIGNATAFSPEYLLRTGFMYNSERLDVALTATLVDEQYWQDSNQSRGTGVDEIDALIPSYEVVDLTAEYRLHPQWALYGGINNVFDENYYSRVRNDGIEPALERTVFAGVRFQM
jgi:Fe(3+) dicitrate transport protein